MRQFAAAAVVFVWLVGAPACSLRSEGTSSGDTRKRPWTTSVGEASMKARRKWRPQSVLDVSHPVKTATGVASSPITLDGKTTEETTASTTPAIQRSGRSAKLADALKSQEELEEEIKRSLAEPTSTLFTARHLPRGGAAIPQLGRARRALVALAAIVGSRNGERIMNSAMPLIPGQLHLAAKVPAVGQLAAHKRAEPERLSEER
mmetsp:Transcript_1514/g.4081  ORF Transcript_1514/g.4081 Transcript_1514/m.4081 type:complete len:205 (+) Transcript_1514:51-665(+)